MTDQSSEAILYYQITLAVHVDLATERVRRVVELREEIHPREGDPTMIGRPPCPMNSAGGVGLLDADTITPPDEELGRGSSRVIVAVRAA